jgi:hypothetical protein
MYTNAFSETGHQVTEPVVSAVASVPVVSTGLPLPAAKTAKTGPLTKVKNTGLMLDGEQQKVEVDLLNPLARGHTMPSGSAIKSFVGKLLFAKTLAMTMMTMTSRLLRQLVESPAVHRLSTLTIFPLCITIEKVCTAVW